MEHDYYALTDAFSRATKLRKKKPSLHLLSPFDNMIILRERLEELFDFYYRLECYTPPAKRKYGYYVLPILWDEQFVGRLDAKADKKSKVLEVKSLVFEPGFKDYDEITAPLAAKLDTLRSFTKCDRTKLGNVLPATLKKQLAKS
jgi:uncharacterized protein